MRRSFQPDRTRIVGGILLVGLVVMAGLGLFGPTYTRSATEAGHLQVELEYPIRARASAPAHLSVEARNVGAATVGPLTIHVDRAYLDAFTVERSDPPMSLTADSYVLELGELGGGASRSVVLHLEGKGVGRRSGALELVAPGRLLRLELTTTTFP